MCLISIKAFSHWSEQTRKIESVQSRFTKRLNGIGNLSNTVDRLVFLTRVWRGRLIDDLTMYFKVLHIWLFWNLLLCSSYSLSVNTGVILLSFQNMFLSEKSDVVQNQFAYRAINVRSRLDSVVIESASLSAFYHNLLKMSLQLIVNLVMNCCCLSGQVSVLIILWFRNVHDHVLVGLQL